MGGVRIGVIGALTALRLWKWKEKEGDIRRFMDFGKITDNRKATYNGPFFKEADVLKISGRSHLG